MPAPVPRQSASGVASSNSPVAVPYTSNLIAGTKLLAFIQASDSTQNSQPTVTGVTDGNGNAFTLLRDVMSTGGGFWSHYYLYALDTPTADVGTKPTVTASVAGATVYSAMIVQEVPGLMAGYAPPMVGPAPMDGNPVIACNAGAAPSFTTGTPPYASTAAGEYLFSFYGDDGDGSGCTWTAPAGYTTDPASLNSQAGNNGELAVAYKASTGGTETGSWSVTVGASSTNYGIIFGAFQLATAAPAPAVTTTGLIPAHESTAYSFQLTASGGTAPYSWSISSGSLPGWATLTAASGIISGTAPGSAASTTFTVKVTDAASNTATRSLILAVLAAAASHTDTTNDQTFVYNAPSQDPQITQNVSGEFGSTPYVGPDVFNMPGGGTTTLTAWTVRNWNVAATFNNSGGSVVQFVNTGFYYNPSIVIDDYAYLVSGWNQLMDWAPNPSNGIIASGCYDLWFSTATTSQAFEVMIHYYLQNRGQGPNYVTGIPFGGYYVQTSAGRIYVPLNYWNLVWAGSGSQTAYWDIADSGGVNYQKPGLPVGVVDVLAMLKYLISPLGIWPAHTVLPAQTPPDISGFSHGYEICSTDNASHVFANNDFFWYGGLPSSAGGLLLSCFP